MMAMDGGGVKDFLASLLISSDVIFQTSHIGHTQKCFSFRTKGTAAKTPAAKNGGEDDTSYDETQMLA